MKYFDEQTAQDLEFDQIRDFLSSFCLNETAKSRMIKLRPFHEPEKAIHALELAHELQLIRNKGLRFPRLEFQELKKEIRLLNIKDSILTLEGIVRLLDASRLLNELLLYFKEEQEQFPMLSKLVKSAYYTKDIVNAIEKVLDRRLRVKDDASEELSHIRQQMRKVKKQINHNFDKVLKSARAKGFMTDISENIIDDRRVLTIMSAFKRQVDGNILGTSKTGSLTYIEPRANEALNIEWAQLQDDERKEIQRIFKQLTDGFRGHLGLIKSYQYVLCELDVINAKVRLAQKMDAALPQIDTSVRVIQLFDAFHPLLLITNQSLKKKTVPQSLLLDEEKRMLVISGPNAGGKSITLKTVGLLQLMFQSGLLIPASTKSKLGWFDTVLSDIGDNQSIENQLSTYSYRLQRMKFFLRKSNPKRSYC